MYEFHEEIHTFSIHVHVTVRMYENNQCSYILFFEILQKPFEFLHFVISRKISTFDDHSMRTIVSVLKFFFIFIIYI